MKELMMTFSLGDESLWLEYDNDEGVFVVTLGPKMGGTRCVIGTHVERPLGVYMFNHEAQAMQSKWERET